MAVFLPPGAGVAAADAAAGDDTATAVVVTATFSCVSVTTETFFAVKAAKASFNDFESGESGVPQHMLALRMYIRAGSSRE